MKKKFHERIFHDFGRFKKTFLIMRLSFIILLISSLTVVGNSYSQTTKFSFQLSKATIKDVFQTIERNSEFIIVYSDNVIDVSREVSVKVSDSPVEKILDQILKESGNGYQIKDRQIVITDRTESPVNVMQKHDVKGVVKATDGSPLPGATVVEKGTTNGTITDVDGKFSLSVKENSTLSFSFVGYTSVEMEYKGQATINVILKEESIGIDEVVAVGYGVQRKSDLTGATNRLSEKDMNKSLAISPVEMMQGRIAGVNITQNNGEPGGGVTVRVRGSSSIRSGQEPLYVVDGIPLDNSNLTPSGGSAAGYGSGGSKNPLSFLNPEDIESIDILKDASSTAIYGARGANGVVLVTTKKGKKGESTITLDSYLGVSNIREKMDVLSASDFRKYTRADGSKLLDLGASVNWQDEIFRTAITQNHALGWSGGTDKSSYHLSLGYLDQQGIVHNSGLKKLNGSVKLTQKAFNDKLLLTGSLMASQQEDSRLPISEASGSGYEGDLIITALKSNPTFPIYNADGTYYQHTTDQRNPVAMMNLVDDKVNTIRVVANVSAEYEIIKGLKYKLNIGLDRANAERRVNQDQQLSYLSNKGEANINGIIANNKLIENYITYATEFNKIHSFNFLLGHSYQNFNGTSNNTNVKGFTVQGIKYTDNLGYGNFSQAVVSSAAYERELQSFFGRVNYSLRDRYLLTFTMRRDGSSKFGANNKYGNFPSAALAWRLMEENFMKNQQVFSNLKLRLGWGLTGNQEIPDKISLMSVGTASNANFLSNGVLVPGITFNRTPNPDIKWETTKQVNVGFDFGVLKDRISGTFDLFSKKTTDVLLEISAKAPAPTSTQWQNVPGLEIQNNGIELGLTGVIIDKPGLKWDATFNVSHIKNEVKGLTTPIVTGAAAGQGLSGTFVQLIANDQPIGSFYGMVFEGFDSNGISQYKKDANGNAVKEFLGTALPDLTYSLSSSLRYKGFDASMFWYGTHGNKVYNNTANALFVKGTLDKSSNVRSDIATSSESPSNSNAFSSRFIEDGSFLRLANLTVGYTFNTKSIKWLSKLRVYATGNNLILITKYKGFDPEVNSDASSNNVPSLGVDYSSFPKSRTFTFGVNLQF
jgi:iron complex outermembrane receptor protein